MANETGDTNDNMSHMKRKNSGKNASVDDKQNNGSTSDSSHEKGKAAEEQDQQALEENAGDENKKEVNENSNVEVKSSFPSSRAFVTVSEPEVTYKIPKNVLSVNVSDLEAMITEKQTDENKDIVEYITSRI